MPKNLLSGVMGLSIRGNQAYSIPLLDAILGSAINSRVTLCFHDEVNHQRG